MSLQGPRDCSPRAFCMKGSKTMPSPYRELLGPDLDRLPPALREFHDVETCWQGEAEFTVTRGKGWLRNLVAWLGGLPPAGEKVRVSLRCQAESAKGRRAEVWNRDFNGFPMRSVQWAEGGLLMEKFGLLTLAYRLSVEPPAMRLWVVRAWVLGIPIPLFLAPTGQGFERAEENGSLSIRVAAFAPLLGQVVSYEGTLRPV